MEKNNCQLFLHTANIEGAIDALRRSFPFLLKISVGNLFTEFHEVINGISLFTLVLTIVLLILFTRTKMKLQHSARLNGELQHALLGFENNLLKLTSEREWLIREINHRVKNNLQVISSLLSNQSAYLTSEDALKTIKNAQRRLYTISLAYHKLYQPQHFATVNLKLYVEDLVNYMSDEYQTKDNITFLVEIIDVPLEINIVIPLGLIIYEAVSNAVKFAFPGNAIGEIKISVEHGQAEKLLLTISDNGIGLPCTFNPNVNTTFGTSLIMGLSRQLGGECNLNVKDGLTITLEFSSLDQEINS